MIKHIVMWKLLEAAEGNTKAQNAQLAVFPFMKAIRSERRVVDYEV